MACSAGSYSSLANSSTCTQCAAGTYTSLAGSMICMACTAGSYSSSANSSICTQCSLGSYSSATNSTICLACTAGSYSSSASSTACTQCIAGSYTSSASSSICAQCSAGSYTSSSSSSTCTQCAAGSYTSSASSTACTNCTRCDPALAVLSNPCPAGSPANTVQCACKAGYYGSGVSCTPCPAYTTSQSNSSSLLSCKCLQGYVCTYTKTINATVHIVNMTLAQFTTSYQANLKTMLAQAANVTAAQVQIISYASSPIMRRRILLPPRLDVVVTIRGAVHLHPHKQIAHVSWRHAHQMHVTKTLLY